MLNIGYWLGSASLNKGGISPYAWRLLDALIEREKEKGYSLVIFCSEQNKDHCLNVIKKYNSKSSVKLIPRKTNRNIFLYIYLLCHFMTTNKFRRLFFDLSIYHFWFQWVCFLNLDIIHIPYQTIPRHIQCKLPCPVVVTMHDIQEIHFPEFFTPQERAYRADLYLKSITIASSIVVSFEHVKNDLIKYFSLPENQISVCPLPYDKICLKIPTDIESEKYKNKYIQWKNFLFYPAQSWPHKNHISLIKAIQCIKVKYGRHINIVFTGKKNVFFSKILEFITKNNLCDQVHFMDIVSEQELYWLYKNCSLVVIPSLYEAGSFPLLEAMSLNVPVICSSVTSLPETIGDIRFVFDPLDIKQMASLIIRMLDNNNLKLENVRIGKNRVRQLMEIDYISDYINIWKNISSKIN